MHTFRIEQHQLHNPALRPGAGPLTFAHVSDLHLKRWRPRLQRLLDTINQRAVDLCFVTGDFITVASATLECAARFFGGLRCRHGAFVVRGNWELACGPALRRLRALTQAWGATLLVNESRLVQTQAGPVRVMGLDDLGGGWPDFSSALHCSPDGAEFTVLLAHAPLAAALLPAGHGVDLVLSGHTHGGQIRLPLLWRLFLPHGHGGFTAGFYDVGGTKLYVSRGFGYGGVLPMRFACPSEVAFFRVLPGEPAR